MNEDFKTLFQKYFLYEVLTFLQWNWKRASPRWKRIVQCGRSSRILKPWKSGPTSCTNNWWTNKLCIPRTWTIWPDSWSTTKKFNEPWQSDNHPWSVPIPRPDSWWTNWRAPVTKKIWLISTPSGRISCSICSTIQMILVNGAKTWRLSR